MQVAATIPAAKACIDQMVMEHTFAYAQEGAPTQLLVERPTSARFGAVGVPTIVILGDGEMPVLAEQGELMARSIRMHA